MDACLYHDTTVTVRVTLPCEVLVLPRMACTAAGYVRLRGPMSLGWRYACVSSKDVYSVTAAKASRSAGPAIHPMVEMAHASDSIPDPITVVMM